MRILNLGCGDDDFGTDRVDFVKTKTTTKVSDLNKPFPYPNNYFDQIYCKSVLEHIKNLCNFVDECYRVLKPNGRIWVRTDNAGFLPLHLLEKHEHNLAYKSKVINDKHYHLFVESHLRFLFSKFNIINIDYYYGASNLFKKLIYKLLPKHIGACHIELTAIK